MTREELEMRTLVRESDVIDRTDGSELAKAFNHLWEKYVENEPCEDAISRKQAIYVASGFCHPANVAKELAKLPSVNPRPKTGHWIEEFGGCECSECGCLEGGYSDYCPNCGAKMAESEDKE